MLGLLKMCYACLEMNNQELMDISTIDFDNTSFLYKLQTCVSSTLDENSSKLICAACIKQLRMCYKFREMVMLSQDVLLKRKDELLTSDNSDLTYKLDIDGQFFQAECLTVKAGSENFDLQLIEKAEDVEFCFIDDLKSDSALVTNDLKSDKELNFNEQCNEYFSDDETKEEEVELEVPRGRKKKRKVAQSEMVYECYHCGTIFNKRWKLQKHISRVHTILKKHVCAYCDKGFKQSYHLREHLTSHTGERKYTCSVCNKTFQRISSMKRHSRSHDRAPGEKTKKTPFLCTVCGKNFPFSNGVQRHMRIHLGIKNHECSICQRRFTQSTHLHVHMRTHTGEKPYICHTCGEAFSLNAGLQKHMTIHNSTSDNELVEMYPKTSVEII